MFHLNNNPSRTAIVNNKEFLFFSGYAYLGVQHNQQFIQLVQEGLEKYGWLFPSSRISNTQLSIFQEFETLLSSITNTNYTCSFASGYSAGTVASTLYKNHVNFVCPEAHPAINKTQQPTSSFDKWAEQTLHQLHENHFDRIPVLIADSVNPITGEVNDFDFLKFIDKPLIVIIDDSHGVGLLGNNGEGITSLLHKKEYIEYIFTYSLSKAFGINGGAISCSNPNLAKTIKSLPEFTASTPISPALLHAFINGQHIYAEQRQQLKKNIQFLRTTLTNNHTIFNDEHLPFFILPPHLDEAYFEANNIIISSFAYPNPQGKKINRAVLNSLHTQQDLIDLSSAILNV